MILQAPTTSLGATENEEAIPWECQNGNYRELIGSNHGHRFYDYSGSSKDNIHENNPQYSVGYDNWFRFRLKEATRMLEGNELDKNLNHVKMVCICSVFSLLMQKKLCQILIIHRLVYILEPGIYRIEIQLNNVLKITFQYSLFSPLEFSWFRMKRIGIT